MVQHAYPGIGRLAFVILYPIFWLLACAVIFGALVLTPDLLLPLMTEAWHVGAWMWGMVIGGNVIILWALGYVSVLRMRNLGMSGWWALLQYTPFPGIWIWWRLWACPEGYADHKQLDLAGKVVTGFLTVLIVLPMVIAVIDKLLATGGGITTSSP